MFTPEFIDESRGEFVLVANHRLESAESVALSVAFCRGRLALANQHLPASVRRGVVIYDLRGQKPVAGAIEEVRSKLGDICEVRIRQS